MRRGLMILALILAAAWVGMVWSQVLVEVGQKLAHTG